MASLSRSKAVLELGKRLVAQIDDKGDLLAGWLAHMIAERMHAAETAPPESRAAAEENCMNVILELWRHRQTLPGKLRPLQEVEPLLRTLQSLEAEYSSFRYYPNALRAAELAEAPPDVRRWLEFATGVDYTARLLIRFALQAAAGGMAEEAASWVGLARAAGAETAPEDLVIKIAGINDESSEEGLELTALKEKLSRLEIFVRLAEVLKESMREQLSGADK